MQGYDLDDTLAKVRWQSDLARAFASAPVLYKPTQDFIVITARQHDTAAERSATRTWLKDNQPNFKRIYYVNGDSEQAKAKAKARVIKNQDLTSYTDNNRDILKIIKETVSSSVTLYFMHADGTKTIY